MPSKYSYALVLADLENRGLIDAGRRPPPPTGYASPSSAQGGSPTEAPEALWTLEEQPAPITPPKALRILGLESLPTTSRKRSSVGATQPSVTPPRGRSPVRARYGSPRKVERPSSTAQPGPSVLHLPEPISDSRAATPTPTLPTRTNSAPPIPRRSSLRQLVTHSRNTSFTESFTSLSTTSSSSRPASSIVTEIYAPLRGPSPSRLGHHPATLSTDLALRPSALVPRPASKRSPQTVHSTSNSSSTPRSYTTNAKTYNSSPISTDSEVFARDDEPYFGSDEGDSESLSSFSSFSTLDYAIKPWEDPRLYPDLYRFKPPPTPESYRTSNSHSPVIEEASSRSSSISRFSLFSRQRGSSPDDAAPPPIARTRHVAFALPPKHSPTTRVTNRLSKLRPSLSLSRRPLSHIDHTKASNPVTFIPFADPTHESLYSSTESRDDSHLAFKNWQASVFDIAGMSEEEQERLRKKGINPRLKAEMEAARKGRWLGPLVGNTFIG